MSAPIRDTGTQFAGLSDLERAAAMAEPHLSVCDAPTIEECLQCRGVLRVIRAVLAAVEPVAGREAGTLRAGWQALRELERHMQERAGFPILDPRVCAPCMRYGVAVSLRGQEPSEVLHLRCEDAQRWQRQVEAANKVVFGGEGR